MESVHANVKSVTANVAKKTITVSFVMAMDEESLRKAEALAFYVDKGQVLLVVTPRQMSMSMETKESSDVRTSQ